MTTGSVTAAAPRIFHESPLHAHRPDGLAGIDRRARSHRFGNFNSANCFAAANTARSIGRRSVDEPVQMPSHDV